jgi:hypothetical protein
MPSFSYYHDITAAAENLQPMRTLMLIVRASEALECGCSLPLWLSQLAGAESSLSL